jgi:hypothetical protein
MCTCAWVYERGGGRGQKKYEVAGVMNSLIDRKIENIILKVSPYDVCRNW